MNRIVVVLSIATCLVGGCAVSGVITEASGSRVGSMTPDFHYVSTHGRKTSFNWARCPIALVAFTLREGSAYYQLDPTMVELADRLWDLPVTVAQVSLPQDSGVPGPGRVGVFDLRKSGMMCLYDANRVAWEAYGRPAPGELILIDEHGRIVMVGSLTDPEPVLQEARRLGWIAKNRREAGEQGCSF